ncbi:Putative transposon Tn552 DNA-invertase bin3 [Streptomyces sp. YIM 121038]|uniref:recombinase family protein n=1 Tax=Streptomyces sp. YIM 121038 TaxID=2136401 RepID=UPI001110D342|nr:recombinase family protein [Streptomyces sp. YIM 121038]QCX75486.1 Putative transposon Tn552 DNA-invertase bin3 [Streptomyces sp. YIM 121038]
MANTTRTDEETIALAESEACSTCTAEQGHPCRTASGAPAASYHTSRTSLVPELAKAKRVVVPRGRGTDYRTPRTTVATATALLLLGYARVSTSKQSTASQVDALTDYGVSPEHIHAENESTRERDKRHAWQHVLDEAVQARRFGLAVTLVVTDEERIGRDADEMVKDAETLRTNGITLRILSGPLAGEHRPDGDNTLFKIFAVLAERKRESIREKVLRGQGTARKNGKTVGRPVVGTTAMAAQVRALKDGGMSVPEICDAVTFKDAKGKLKNPSRATVYRLLQEGEAMA